MLKSLGKLSYDQLRRTLKLANEQPTLQNLGELVGSRPRFRKVVEDAGEVFGWAWAYDLTLPELIVLLFLAMDTQDVLVNAIMSDDPQEAILALAESDEDLPSTSDDVPMWRKLLVLELLIALFKTLDCYRSYSQPLCDLVAKARAGSVQALCNAARIDATVLSTPSIAQIVSEATLHGDRKLLRQIKGAYATPRKKLVMYADLRLVEVLFHEACTFIEAKPELIYDVVVNQLRMYDHRGEDPRKALLTLFKRWRESATT